MQPARKIILYFTLLIVTAQANVLKVTENFHGTHQSLYSRDADELVSVNLANCVCGYYIPETKQTFTHHVSLSPSALNSSNLTVALYKQGWIISDREQTSTPKNIKYSPSNLKYNANTKALELTVSGGPTSRSIIPSAEISTIMGKILYGSFRFNVKVSSVAGACSGMFFYKDDNHEIDIEILTSHIHNTTKQPDGVPKPGLQLTVQPLTKTQALSNYRVVPFDGRFDPTKGYHEYRFDWLKTGVKYTVDGNSYGTYTRFIPKSAGQILINNWSNGNRYWPAGPPLQNSILSIRSVDIYFNTTDATEIATWRAASSIKGLEKPDNDTRPIPPDVGDSGVVARLNNTNQSIQITSNADAEPEKQPRKQDFDGTPYVETLEIQCQSPGHVISFWAGRTTFELNPGMFFPEDQNLEFGNLDAPPSLVAIHWRGIQNRQAICQHCQCYDSDGIVTEPRPGAIFSTDVVVGGPCTWQETANACFSIFHDLFAAMGTVQEIKSGFVRSRHRKMLVPGTKEPYYLEGPDEQPARHHRPPLHDLVRNLGGYRSSPSHKIKRSSNLGGDSHIPFAPLFPTNDKVIEEFEISPVAVKNPTPLIEADSSQRGDGSDADADPDPSLP
ncbi:hypothetical protein TWF703_010849 [Orbilia oligospora]|uniref:GH16 domain-containing protein n=1 Tax=Orbilia oligospora TaxID=2813651 RepID=A0A7C8K0Q2_ORBOL|nr:hypothetical protein TWF703_010849 [Orbilia oligospora]